MRFTVPIQRVACAALVAVSALVLPVASGAQSAPPEAPRVAQTAPDTVPVSVSHVEGGVELVDSQGVRGATAPDLLDDDTRVVTRDGRAELALADGSLAHLDRRSEARIDLGGRLRFVRGRLAVRTVPGGTTVVIATPAGLVRLAADGEYRLDAEDLDGDTVIAVVEGRATLASAGRETAVSPEQSSIHADPRGIRPIRFARARAASTLGDWSRARVSAAVLTSHPALPVSVTPWAPTFATYGSWVSVAPYGDVWLPRVSLGWRPYSYGRWSYTRYGWTWFDRDPWLWAAHHYGRWGHHPGYGWFWIPEPTWGPAWVSWAHTLDYVAWGPLGWHATPVVDLHREYRESTNAIWAPTWSVLATSSFGRREVPTTDGQDLRRLPGLVAGGFTSGLIGPPPPADAPRVVPVVAGPVVSRPHDAATSTSSVVTTGAEPIAPPRGQSAGIAAGVPSRPNTAPSGTPSPGAVAPVASAPAATAPTAPAPAWDAPGNIRYPRSDGRGGVGRDPYDRRGRGTDPWGARRPGAGGTEPYSPPPSGRGREGTRGAGSPYDGGPSTGRATGGDATARGDGAAGAGQAGGRGGTTAGGAATPAGGRDGSTGAPASGVAPPGAVRGRPPGRSGARSGPAGSTRPPG